MRSLSTARSCVGQSLIPSKNVVLKTNMTPTQLQLEGLSDDQLLDEIKRLAQLERTATADLLRCLIEVDTRRLYLREGCGSLFTYCTQVLHLAEGAAYNRIEAARAARRFPIVLERIADGSLTLTSARLLAPHLTVENYETLLEAARYKGKREVEVMIATQHPHPAVRTVLRKVPSAQVGGSSASATTPASGAASRDVEPPPVLEAARSTERSAQDRTAAAPRTEQSRRVSEAKPRHEAAPVSASDYRLQVTISAGTHDKLRRAGDLLRHTIPDGNVAAILDRALTLLRADVEKRRASGGTCAAHSRRRARASRRRRSRVRRGTGPRRAARGRTERARARGPRRRAGRRP